MFATHGEYDSLADRKTIMCIIVCSFFLITSLLIILHTFSKKAMTIMYMSKNSKQQGFLS